MPRQGSLCIAVGYGEQAVRMRARTLWPVTWLTERGGGSTTHDHILEVLKDYIYAVYIGGWGGKEKHTLQSIV